MSQLTPPVDYIYLFIQTFLYSFAEWLLFLNEPLELGKYQFLLRPPFVFSLEQTACSKGVFRAHSIGAFLRLKTVCPAMSHIFPYHHYFGALRKSDLRNRGDASQVK